MPVPVWPVSQGALATPQTPHNSATRRPIPTGIPPTKRHTPVHLLCVLKHGKQPVASIDARELGCWSIFQVRAVGVIELLKSGGSIIQVVAYNTVQRAVVMLRECGLIVIVHGRSTYVA